MASKSEKDLAKRKERLRGATIEDLSDYNTSLDLTSDKHVPRESEIDSTMDNVMGLLEDAMKEKPAETKQAEVTSSKESNEK